MITILGAGLAGLSCAFHLGHERCILFERNSYAGGHIYSHHRDGFIWDEGPHVSFTKHAYVRELFEESVERQLLEYPVQVGNYYQGAWIPHPAQSNLYAVPEPLRSRCLEDFLTIRNSEAPGKPSANYAEWLQQAFGETFATTFPTVYTRKYWTREPRDLATDWVGERVFYPDVEIVQKGFRGPPSQTTHYVNTVRYPSRGGYIRFAKKLEHGANIQFEHQITRIDLKEREIFFANGKQHRYERLINTLPLPEFIRIASDVPADVRQAAATLCCSRLLLVNVTANHAARQPYHWLYVYDEDKLSTRINHIELLSPDNAPTGKTGLQVEVYDSRYRPFPADQAAIAKIIVAELLEMGLIEQPESVHTRMIPYANVIFDHERRDAQDQVLKWLTQYGLEREADDLEPMTQWTQTTNLNTGWLTLAGRFAQWKYYWTDDCVLRGRALIDAST
ncbi:protoporphyrinogen/coproporphyrinogen oxidase [Pseudomonadota bacterium]